MDKLRSEHGNLEHGETYKGFSIGYWSFTRQLLTQSLSKLPEADDQTALHMFHLTLTYAGLGQNGNT